MTVFCGAPIENCVSISKFSPRFVPLSFYDRAKVIALPDGLPALGAEARTARDPVLMILLSACTLQERYKV